jgi:hypothetical protein
MFFVHRGDAAPALFEFAEAVHAIAAFVEFIDWEYRFFLSAGEPKLEAWVRVGLLRLIELRRSHVYDEYFKELRGLEGDLDRCCSPLFEEELRGANPFEVRRALIVLGTIEWFERLQPSYDAARSTCAQLDRKFVEALASKIAALRPRDREALTNAPVTRHASFLYRTVVATKADRRPASTPPKVGKRYFYECLCEALRGSPSPLSNRDLAELSIAFGIETGSIDTGLRCWRNNRTYWARTALPAPREIPFPRGVQRAR